MDRNQTIYLIALTALALVLFWEFAPRRGFWNDLRHYLLGACVAMAWLFVILPGQP